MDYIVMTIAHEQAGKVLLFWMAIALVLGAFLMRKSLWSQKTRAPTFTFYNPLVPRILSRLKFNSCAPVVIFGGYQKVSAIHFIYEDRQPGLVQRNAL